MSRTARPVTCSRDAALDAAIRCAPAYPGASAMLDAADRAWLASQGLPVPARPEVVPLTELARRARQAPAKKKKGTLRKTT